MARPSKPLITRDIAVAEAIKIIDTEGLESFSLPRLARNLNVQAPSLYHHFSDKNEILGEVARFIGGASVKRPKMVPGPEWPEYFVNLAMNFRQSILRHRNAAPILLQHLPRDLFIPTYESTSSFLLESGVPIKLHVQILDGVETLSVGAVLMEAMRRPSTKTTIFANVSPLTQPLLSEALANNQLTQRCLFQGLVRSFLHGIIRDHNLDNTIQDTKTSAVSAHFQETIGDSSEVSPDLEFS